jgi:transcriptional regulator with XRE-family HTH domain
VDVGELLRQARTRAGVSQRELARNARTSQAALSAYECGASSPTVRTLDRLLAACGVQVRAGLEPMLAGLDARVDALEGEPVPLDGDRWRPFADTLDGRPSGSTWVDRAPRRGPVRWAVDGAAALTVHGLAAPAPAVEVVVELDEALRSWMKAVGLRGVSPRGFDVQDWYDADLARMQGALGEPRFSLLGMVRPRVVARLPETVEVAVGWLDRPVPVMSADEVERGHPAHAEVLARWRQRRTVGS